jgi:radical SAM superfamily enzyme YgiQ (UPF0313 family)
MPANRSTDVLLTHSYHLASDAKQWRKMQPYPPLGTLYAATALEGAGISVAVFDSMFAEPVAGFRQALAQHRPKIVVIYEDDFNFVTKMCLLHMRELAWRLAQIAQEHGIPVIAHGSDATDHPNLFLDHGITYVLNGEAEQTLTELCTSLLATGHARPLPGLIHYDDQGRETGSATRAPKNASWAKLPEPMRQLIDLEPYREAWRGKHGYFSVNVVSSRGCPYQCNWCAKPISGNRYQLRAPEAVAAELHTLKTEHGVEHIWFGDDVFALDHRWVESFARAVEALGAPVPFKIQSRADLMSESTVAALKRAGCAEVWLGAESGSQKILNAMTKGLNVASIFTARRRLADAGIRACYFLQFGYPGEQWPEITETIRLVRETRPDDIGVSLSYPLPGTVFFAQVQQQLGDKRNWSDSDDLCAMHLAAYRDEFYHALRDALHAEVNAVRATGAVDQHCQALWRRVYEMEPSSRNSNVLPYAPVQETTAFFPLASLNLGRGRA